MTTLRHQLLDAQGKPIVGHPASVSPYVYDIPSGSYRRVTGVRAVSDSSGWLTWTLPLIPGESAPIYYVLGIQTDPVLVQVPVTASTALVMDTRISTVGLGGAPGVHPSIPPVAPDPYVTETELVNRLSGIVQPLPTTDAQREQYVPARLSATNFNKLAVIADIGTAGTSTGDALRAAYVSAPTSGFTPSAFTHWDAAVARVKAGSGDAKLLCVGDSTTAGVGVDGNGTQGLPGAYPARLSTVLLANGITAASGLGIPGPNSSNGDSRWSFGSGWAPYSGSGFGWGNTSDAQAYSGVTTATTYTSGIWSDHYDIYYLTNTSGLGGFTVSATGGSPVTRSSNTATAGIGKVTVSAASAALNNVVTITPDGTNTVHILGVEPWLSTTSQVRVGNAGVGGSKATDWADPGTGPAWNAQAAIKTYAPDLTVISLGVNDGNAGVTVSNYAAAITTLVTAAQASGDVVLVSPVPSQLSTGSNVTNEISYGAKLATMGLPLIDLSKHWGSGDVLNARGLMWDARHPNGAGYADLAALLGGVLARV